MSGGTVNAFDTLAKLLECVLNLLSSPDPHLVLA
jgi:hypothetical protein